MYAKKGTANVCFKGCESSENELDCYSWSNNTIGGGFLPFSPRDNTTGVDHIFHDAVGRTFLTTPNDHHNTGLGNDIVKGLNERDVIEDHGGKDIIFSRGGDDYFISNSGGDFWLSGAKEGDQNTLRLYPTHEKDHLFGWKDMDDGRQCTTIMDMWDETAVELVLDDPWFPDAKYTKDDDYCAVLVHGWELGWYWNSWDDGEDGGSGNNRVDIWFSRETGAADFCLHPNSDDIFAASCVGPEETEDGFCITYWVKCEAKDYDTPSTVEQDLIDQAWTSWFGW